MKDPCSTEKNMSIVRNDSVSVYVNYTQAFKSLKYP
jgi:hypothetical protein